MAKNDGKVTNEQSGFAKSSAPGREFLRKMATAAPYFKPGSMICSYFLKGNCFAGDKCPHRYS